MKTWLLLNTGTKDTLTPRDYEFFAMAILSQKYKEINITKLILVNISHNCLFQGVFPIMLSWDSLNVDSMAANFSLTAGWCRNHFQHQEGQFPSKFDVVNRKPLGIGKEKLIIYRFCSFLSCNCLTKGFSL